MSQFATGRRALALCDVCSFTYKLRELRFLVVKGKVTNTKACPECWNPDHPQLMLGSFPVYDPQALRDPRPDVAEFPQERALILPMPSLTASSAVGYVTIDIT